LPLRFEIARTALALGQVQRRRRRRAAARTSFERAEGLFAEIGAVLWEARAARERERLDPGAADLSLTPAEERTASLAASGLTNREIAAELFVSVKTVEVTLTRVYRKLGIRSRAQLGAWAAAREMAGEPAPSPAAPEPSSPPA
jgi:DNA-binding CsgD family transcriptional regulator